jgi:hypothetical protein
MIGKASPERGADVEHCQPGRDVSHITNNCGKYDVKQRAGNSECKEDFVGPDIAVVLRKSSENGLGQFLAPDEDPENPVDNYQADNNHNAL